MGLYDEGDNEEIQETTNNEPIGKAIASVNKKPLKDKSNKKIPANSEFEFPEWLKTVLIAVIGIILVAIIGYVAYMGFKPDYLSIDLKPNPSYISDGSSSTKLYVEVKNINEYDLKNLELTIIPTDKLSVAVIPSDPKKIAILGANEKRQFEYDVTSIGNISPGEYGITINLKTPEETISEQVFWEIKNHK